MAPERTDPDAGGRPGDGESPSPSQPESPPRRQAAAASSPASSAASSPFVAEPGPDFEPGEERPPEEPQGATLHALPTIVEWEEQQVRDILNAQGKAAHSLFGVGEQDWAYTEDDLATIARPLTRILNRYDVSRAAAGTGDELAVLIGLGGYVGRSYSERRAVLEALAEQAEAEPEPITGARAEPDTGPPPPRAPHFAGADEPPAGEAPSGEEIEWTTGP